MTLPADDEDLRRRAAEIPTTLLSDILADHGHEAQVLATGIQAVHPAAPRVAGWAYTVSGSTMPAGESGPDLRKARAIDETPANSVPVWAGNGVQDVCMFGDLLAAAMRVRGAVAAVVDGGVRDVDDIDPATFPVYARYRTPKASTGVWRVEASQVAVRLEGVLGTRVEVVPGDLVVADQNGVAVVPRGVAAQIVAACEAHLAKESEIRARIEAREGVEDLLLRYGRI
jgi:regulator of RNase E activity RraA